INADKLWKRGVTGKGRLVMGLDTGVDGNHPALSARWRGNDPGVPPNAAWFDPDGSTFPFDNNSHGTHTMGTMAGLDTLTHDTIGVAFEAKWIAARTIGAGGDYTSNNIAAYQWAMNPDGDPNTIEDMPDAIGCSWRDPYVEDCNPVYAMTLSAVEAAGIAVVFSAGNQGGAPNSSTITKPKNLNMTLVNTFATGGINANVPDLPAYVNTSKGPSRCGGVGSQLIKPEASAPAVGVRSAVPGGGYGNKTGTSMACPHVVGAIALLKQVAPHLTGSEIKLALYQTARETPADIYPGEDNTYGMGLIDVWAAFLSLGAPEAPTNFAAYSDYQTPNSMFLQWNDPDRLATGDTLLPNEFLIMIKRDGQLVDSISGGIEHYMDSGLTDGQLYHYEIFAKVDSSGIEGPVVEASWIAGGAPIPSPPNLFVVTGNEQQVKLFWENPSTNIDGTPLDDLAGVKLYQNGEFVTTFQRSPSDTGLADSAIFAPDIPGYYEWAISVVDNEIPPNESEVSPTVGTPLNLPISDPFIENGEPNPGIWVNTTTEVNDRANNPPSPPYALNLNGQPNGEDIVELKPLDLSGFQSGILFSYWYQPQGDGNAPEENDSLRVYFKNDLDEWILVKAYPGRTLQPFQQETILIDTLNSGNGTFYHASFQVRFRSTGGSGNFPNDDWFIDDVFLGIPVSVDQHTEVPSQVLLRHNYPNPFNPSTSIPFTIHTISEVSLKIYDLTGREIKTLLHRKLTPGNYVVKWGGIDETGRAVSSGVYFYRLKVNDKVLTRKMVLVK
ncbi:MAG: T9SS C-terminal target domain-containing protein, partial [Calditrichaeota bacterium]